MYNEIGTDIYHYKLYFVGSEPWINGIVLEDIAKDLSWLDYNSGHHIGLSLM